MLIKKRKVAIFDIDGTLSRFELLEYLIKLISSHVFKKDSLIQYQKIREKLLQKKVTYREYQILLNSFFEYHIKGVYYGDLVDVSKELVLEQKSNVYLHTEKLLIDLKKKGYFTLAISDAPKTLLDLFCRPYKFDKVYGRFYEIGPNDRFTGVISDLHLIGNKANIVKRAIEKENLTLSGSVGIGDSEDDIPFLELVSNAVCFNPSEMLWREAKRMKWSVIIEKKDVIYKIK